MINFKLYPENKSLFFRVFVFDTKEEMYLFDEEGAEKDYLAKFIAVDHYKISSSGDCKKTPLSGFIYFFKDKCGAGIVSHEMTHAALAWARRKKFDFTALDREEEFKDYPNREKLDEDAEIEEDIVWVVGNLVSQFYKHYYDTDEDY